MTAQADDGRPDDTLELMVPFWGDPALLEQLLVSLQAQDDPAWRAVVVDDASPVGAEVADLVRGRDARITLHRNATNLGITGNFQRCLELATSRYVVFPGCDDLTLPNFVRTMRRSIRAHPDCAVHMPAVRVVDEHGQAATGSADAVKARLRRRWPTGQPLGGDPLAASLLTGNWLYFPALAFDRQAAVDAGGFDPRWRVVEDIDLILRLLLRGHRLVLDDEVAFAYRRHSGSVSSVDAVAGSRFDEEREFALVAADRAGQAGWARTSRAARLRGMSRLHALSLLPTAGRAPATARTLVRHALGGPYR